MTDTAARVRELNLYRRYCELVHVDIKKLGNIPDGGGHKVLGRQAGRKTRAGAGYSYLHTAVDDHSRLAYSEIHADEKKETATGFWQRAHSFFTQAGITVERVLTDNGSCYRSSDWRDLLTAAGITHKRTRPYRPNRPTARSNASIAPCSTNGPTPAPTARRPNDAKRSPAGCTPTITTADTPRSRANHPPAASPTSQGNTPSHQDRTTHPIRRPCRPHSRYPAGWHRPRTADGPGSSEWGTGPSRAYGTSPGITSSSIPDQKLWCAQGVARGTIYV